MSKELYTHVVFKFNVYDDNFLLMPSNECPNTGFSSLYSITGETAQTLETAGIAGYKGPVWSQHLVLDFDDQDAATEAHARLRRLGLAFDVYSTGNRGLHFYINRPHSPSHLLPQIDKTWAKSSFPRSDLSIYSNLHMFRLPGTLHAKTGKPKILIESVVGDPLILPDSLPDQPDIRSLLGPESERSIFDNSRIMNWTVPWDEGRRHEALLNLGLAMKSNGEPMEFIARWLYHANLLNAPPKPQEELERIVQFVSDATL